MRELARDRAGLEILHLGDCFGLLGSVPVGRIGFIASGEVVILPVNFLVDGQDVVFTTGPGSKLSAVEVGQYVGFEADCFDTATQSGWSVTVSGLAEVVDSGDETARLDGLGLRPWGGAADRVWVRIRPVSVSGRRIPETAADQVRVPTGTTGGSTPSLRNPASLPTIPADLTNNAAGDGKHRACHFRPPALR